VAAIALGFLAIVKVGFDGGKPTMTYRQAEEWVSYARFRLAWTASDDTSPAQDPGTEANRLSVESLRQARLLNYTVTLARLIDSDAVKKLMRREGRIDGRVDAKPVPALDDSDEILPMLSISGISDSAQNSRRLTTNAAGALTQFVERDQRSVSVPSERVTLQVVNEPGNTTLLAPRSRTLSIVVVLSVLTATIALAFILENLRPSGRSVSLADPARETEGSIRRSA
jgi:hypothetical protein